MYRTALSLSLFAIAAGSLWLPARTAEACGGFFCNREPIDQAGENIAYFVGDDGTMETHVQILYQGTAEEFAWILPVPSLPEVSVGTDILFQQLHALTRPRFQTDYETRGECRPTPSCPSDYYPEDNYAYGGADAGQNSAQDASPASGVEVHFQDAVGPYDAVVLSSGDATALFEWLTDNGYDIPESSTPLLMEYIEADNFFLALKLRQDRGTGEIQPVVLRYTERKPCLPIKLTSIATVPDMPITAFVFGDRRARPSNYMATEPDLDHPGFWTGTESYTQAVNRAVDDAGGRAFVTEYANARPDGISLAIADVDDLREETNPGAFLMRLQERGFSGDSQLLGILLRFIPPPDDEDANGFYNCIVNDWCRDSYATHLEEMAFDPSAFVDALNEAIIEPRRATQAAVEAHAQLTRLFTTMSAEEMTVDPLFDLDESVPVVSNVHTATQITDCSEDYFSFHAPQRLVLPSGGETQLREGIAYRGSDEAYCDDRSGGMYGPSVEPSRARRTAAMRSASLGGGGGCSVAGSSSGAGLAFLAGLVILATARRRRR